VEPAVVGGDLLMGSGAGTEKVTQLVVGPAEYANRSWVLEPTHRTVAAFDTAMILLQSVIEILAVAMPQVPSALAPWSLFDCAWCGYRAAAREVG
jgi:hypothetical protein